MPVERKDLPIIRSARQVASRFIADKELLHLVPFVSEDDVEDPSVVDHGPTGGAERVGSMLILSPFRRKIQ
jgi:hypothetical protein